MAKCAPNAPNGAHLCAKSGEYVRRSGVFYYINVRQIGVHKKVRQWGISGGKAEIKDQHGLMKDRVRDGYGVGGIG